MKTKYPETLVRFPDPALMLDGNCAKNYLWEVKRRIILVSMFSSFSLHYYIINFLKELTFVTYVEKNYQKWNAKVIL